MSLLAHMSKDARIISYKLKEFTVIKKYNKHVCKASLNCFEEAESDAVILKGLKIDSNSDRIIEEIINYIKVDAKNIYIHKGIIKISVYSLMSSIDKLHDKYSQKYDDDGISPYIAPEVLQNNKYTHEANIYSFGTLFYKIITGVSPYRNILRDDDLEIKIRDCLRPELPKHMENLFAQMIIHCRNIEPSQRPEIVELKNKLSQFPDTPKGPQIKTTASDTSKGSQIEITAPKTPEKPQTEVTDPDTPEDLRVNGILNISDDLNLLEFNSKECKAKKIDYSKFSDHEYIGRGASARVYSVMFEGKQFALKALKINKLLDEKDAKRIIRELNLHHNINNSNIIKLFGISQDQNTRELMLILKYANVLDLRTHLKTKLLNDSYTISWIELTKIAIQITDGLKYLHENEIIHGNLHPLNILVNDGCALIADFGLSKELNDPNSSSSWAGGMAAYTDPQCFIQRKRNKKSDIYSLGMLLWELTSGICPFNQDSEPTIILKTLYGKRENVIPNTPQGYSDLYIKCWSPDSNNRPEPEHILLKLKRLSEETFEDIINKITLDNSDNSDNFKLMSNCSWIEPTKIAIQITDGLKYLHENEIIHRDLHPSNILVSDGCALIADFGLSKELNDPNSSSSWAGGMVAYTDPQCFIQRKRSLEVLLWEITSGIRPFNQGPERTIVLKPSYRKKENVIPNTPQGYSDLYIKCWSPDSNNRPEPEHILLKLKRLSEETFEDIINKITLDNSYNSENSYNLKLMFNCSWIIELIKIAIQTTDGLKYLHEKEIIHRDLHPLNILVYNGCALIADFGLSKELNDPSSSSSWAGGMAAYTDPQCFIQRKRSLEVLLWEITSGIRPFNQGPERTIVLKPSYRKKENVIPNTPQGYSDLDIKCWSPDSNNRPEPEHILLKLKRLSEETFEDIINKITLDNSDNLKLMSNCSTSSSKSIETPTYGKDEITSN
ncbi:kinase-like protein [Gigaspora margarita]|uniref:Kinase-like protein n=1 Tax=Gigaspora margarita TaxID=4874 RepID=A0A8H4B0F3_GIGMA|nr:kinase-like protein [Gigaspora margarita]